MFARIEALQLDCIVTSSGRVTGTVNSATLVTRPSSFIVTGICILLALSDQKG